MIELLLGMARVKVNGVIMYLWELQYHLLSLFTSSEELNH